MAHASISLEGIDQAITDLNYRQGSVKQKAIMAIRNFYSSDESINEINSIDSDTLIKLIWEVGDNFSKIKSKRRNFSSLKSSINTDLKKLLKKDKNPENIILADSNIFDLTQEAKEDLLGSFSDAFKKGNIDLDQAASLLEAMTEFLDKTDLEGKEADSQDIADKIKKVLDKISKNISSKDGRDIVDDKAAGKGIEGEGGNGEGDLAELELDEDEELEEIDDLDDDVEEIDLDDDQESDKLELGDDEELEEIDIDEDEEIEEVDEIDEDQELEEVEALDDDIEPVELDEDEELEEIDDFNDDVEEIDLDDDQESDKLELGDDEELEEIDIDEDEEIEEVDEIDEDQELEEVEALDDDIEPVELDEDEELEEIDDFNDDVEEIDLDDDQESDKLELGDDEELEEIDIDEDEEIEEVDEIDEDQELEEVEALDDDIEPVELDEDEELEEIDDFNDDVEEIDLDDDQESDKLELGDNEELEEIEIDEDEEIEEVDEIDEDQELEEVDALDDDIEPIELEEDEELEEIDELDEEEQKALEEFREKRKLAEQFDKTLGEREKKYNKYTKVPKGLYTVGTKKSLKSTLELQQFEMPEVYIGIYPVINSLFEIFVEETGYITSAEQKGFGRVYYSRFKKDSKGSNWNKNSGSQDVKGACWHQPTGPDSSLHGKRNHPVVQVSVDDAFMFASWIGRRLPTETEWESASRTDLGYKFPWGNDFNPKALNIEQSGLSDTNSVDDYDTFANEFKIIDMLGNVMEWTSDMEIPPFKSAKNIKYCVAKGGAWNAKDDVTISSRILFKPGFTSNTIGFRCISEIFL